MLAETIKIYAYSRKQVRRSHKLLSQHARLTPSRYIKYMFMHLSNATTTVVPTLRDIACLFYFCFNDVGSHVFQLIESPAHVLQLP